MQGDFLPHPRKVPLHSCTFSLKVPLHFCTFSPKVPLHFCTFSPKVPLLFCKQHHITVLFTHTYNKTNKITISPLPKRGKIRHAGARDGDGESLRLFVNILRAGVSLPVHLLHARFGDVGIDLGSGERGMAEQLLHGAQVCPGIQQMRGESMAELVR